MRTPTSRIIAATLLAFVSFLPALDALADESPQTEAQNAASDAKTQASKDTRDVKEQGRKASGTDTATQDANDKANNAKDDISNDASKLDHKASG